MVELVLPDVIPVPFKSLLLSEQRFRRGSQWLGYEPQLVPGPLQIFEYAELVLRNYGYRGYDLAVALALRLSRQQFMLERAEEGAQYIFLLNESTVLRQAGNPDVMRAQMDHLVRLAVHPGITIQVLPFVAGEIRGESPMVIIKVTPANKLLFFERMMGDEVYRTGPIVQEYESIFARLQERCLSVPDTLARLAQQSAVWAAA